MSIVIDLFNQGALLFGLIDITKEIRDHFLFVVEIHLICIDFESVSIENDRIHQ